VVDGSVRDTLAWPLDRLLTLPMRERVTTLLGYVLGQDLLLALRMNGVVLPPERGYPLQLVAEDKWGYKWIKRVSRLELRAPIRRTAVSGRNEATTTAAGSRARFASLDTGVPVVEARLSALC
jgi:DMSO/TMAO reductase YedYZ molybdopterin-dependent catalytic subunit